MKPNERSLYQTPNNQIPLNNRPKGEVAQIAFDQLRPYQIAADTWPLYRHYRDERHCMVCRFCDQNVWFLKDEYNHEFEYNDGEIKSLIVAHIRQIHAHLVNEKGEIVADENSREREILDGACNPNTLSVGGGNAYRPEYKGVDSRGIEFS